MIIITFVLLLRYYELDRFVPSNETLLLKLTITKMMGKWHIFLLKTPLMRRAKAARPTCRQNEKSMKRREKP